MASATLARSLPEISEQKMNAVGAAACAIVAKYEGLRLQSVGPDLCVLKSDSKLQFTGGTPEGQHERHEQNILNRKQAHVFFAGVIAAQKMHGRLPAMPRYTLDSLPKVLYAAAVAPDAWKEEETIWADLNLMFLTTRDLLRDDWKGFYWSNATALAETLLECGAEIPGIAAEELIQRLIDQA